MTELMTFLSELAL